MIKKIFRFFLLAAILLVAVVFYQWNHLRLLINTATEQLPRGYTLSYSQHYNNAEGELVILEPILMHNAYGVLFRAERLIYQPPSYGSYWDLTDRIILSDYPVTGEIRLEGLTIPVEQLAKVNKKPSDIEFAEILMLGCGRYSPPSFNAITNMGFAELNGTTEISYRYDSLASSIVFQGSHKLESFSSIEWQLELNDFKPNNDASPYLVYGQWVMFDTQFLSKRDQLCASTNNSSVASFQQKHLNEVITYFEDNKIAPSRELLDRYELFVEKPENLTFSFSPATGIRLEKYDELSLVEKFEQLGIVLNINGRAITQLINKAENTELEKVVKNKTATTDNKEIIKRPSVYRLRQLLDKRVELIDENNKRYKGQIKRVTNQRIELQIRQSGGFATVRFRPYEIRSIEILK
ncbi:MAG: hypothetical protein HWE27_07155 [Gammaproteobacteria bacterium]|nr:hypothetical protein [Gammaproteobacteria bacterium]